MHMVYTIAPLRCACVCGSGSLFVNKHRKYDYYVVGFVWVAKMLSSVCSNKMERDNSRRNETTKCTSHTRAHIKEEIY